ncbi:translocation/assembly module TamB domain-containing protein [Roseococcus suduntuyensis]|uniref:Translocation and assembly module TamB n=1 Tax=Roseococcus suduntuyensis TaxID=455361 RepID=A0A840A895_9PROT|nr:translocation/assembly module TamB domain-containing protein [Roseococcus suduntuyensis]MBB3896756.1 translocation and assembly module TamB [Roseococcus suduntuyensis]
MRALRIFAWLVASLLLLTALALGFLLATPLGNRQVARVAQWAVPGLVLEGVSGPLPGRLSLTRATLADEQGVWLTVEDASLRLEWTALFGREAHITRLEAARIHLARLPEGEPDPDPTPGITLPSLPQLPVAIRLDALDVARLELGAGVPGGPAALSARGHARLAGQAASVELAVRRLDAPGTADLVAELEGDRLVARLAASEPPGGVIATAAGQPEAPFNAELALDSQAWRLDATLGEARVTGAGDLALAGGAVAASGRLDALPGPFVPADYAPLAATVGLDFALRYSAEGDLALDRVVATAPGGRLEGRATLAAHGALAGEAQLDPGAAALFAPFLPEGITYGTATATARFGGTQDNPSATLTARITDPRTNTPADPLLGEVLTLEARYAEHGRDSALALQGARLEARVAGAIPTSGEAPLALDITARVTDPPEAEGTVTLEGRATGTLEAPQLDAVLATEALVYAGRRAGPLRVTVQASPQHVALDANGTLDERPLTLRAEVRQDAEGRVDIRALDGAWAGITLRGGGRFAWPDGQQQAELALAIPDLSVLAPFIGQPVTGALSAEASAAPVEGATGPAAQRFALRVVSPGFAIAGQRGRLDFSLGGTLAEARLELNARSDMASVEASARIRVGDEAAEAVFTRLNLASGQDAARLQGEARVTRVANGDVTLSPARFNASRGGRLVVQGQTRGEALTGRAELAALPLAPFTAGAVVGTMAGQVNVAGSLAAPQARFDLRGEGLRATALEGLPAARLTATGTVTPEAARIEAQINAGPGIALTLNASQPRGLGAAAATEARLQGRLDLGAITRPLLAGGADVVTGRADLDLRLTGSPEAPQLTGTANVTGATYRNDAQGVRLEGITARLVAQGERLVLQQFSARTRGNGTISGEGWVEPLGENIPAELRLTARNARPVQSELGEAVLNADLTLRGPILAGGSLSGRVEITRAELRIPEQFGGSIPTLGEVREVGPRPPGRPAPAPPRAAAAPPAGPPLTLDVQVVAPRAIFVRGRGLEAELSGDIRVGGNLVAPTISGAFNLRRGQFDLAGRVLNLTRGAARFDTGTLIPTLDFLATTRSRTHTITLTISGPANSPELAVGAQPDLPQDEALARLLFDRELQRLSPFEIAALTQAVAQLAGIMPSGGGVTGRIREALGLDRLSAGAAEGGGATVEAGRYVAPGVYVGVRQGTSGAAPGVGVQVELTPRLRLEAETQTGEAGDRVGITWSYEW